jgi:transcription elongation factor Elf1
MAAQSAPSPPGVLSSSRCHHCRGETAVQCITPSQTGYEHWMLRCTSCGRVHQMQVLCSLPQSERLDWFDDNLYAPG